VDEQQLRQASGNFYAALRRTVAGDAAAMDEIWSHDPSVVAMHPLGGKAEGWHQVRGSWAGLAQMRQTVDIDLDDATFVIFGNIGFVTGVEKGDLNVGGGHLDYSARVTNVFCDENGAPKMVLHHVDSSPALAQLVGAELAPDLAPVMA